MNKIRERLFNKAGHMGIPIMGAFELLPLCNLSCKMCYVRKNLEEVNACGGLIPGSKWLEYAKESYEAGLLFPLLTGGEPFLHPDFKEILTGMQEMGMQVSINTNGTMIDEELAKWLSIHTPTRINLTLYGASEETYEKLCGNKNAFNKVKDAVKYLKQYHIPLKFNASITNDNIDDLKDMIEFAKENDCPIQIATYMFPPIRRDETSIGKNNRLSPKKAAYAKVFADYLQKDHRWFIQQAHIYQSFIQLDQIDFTQESQDMPMHCRAGLSSFWIDWQGNMMNCGMSSSVKVALKDYVIKDAWQIIREETKKYKRKSKCTICPNNKLCHSCMAMMNNECGHLDQRPEYLCEYNQEASYYYQIFLEKIKERGLYDDKENIKQDCIDTIIDHNDCDLY